jgi:ABC-2 type transport system permease protein
MSAVPVIDPRPAPRQTDAVSGYGVTLPRVIRSEWIKLRSVRSTVVTLGFAGLAVAVFGVLVSIISNGTAIGGDGEVVTDAAGNSLFGTNIAQLVLGVLGALLISSEYATGLIRATLTAVPKRLPVLWAKVIVVSATTFATMVASVLVAFFAGQALYGGVGEGASLFDPGVPRALLGAALFPTAIAVMGLAFGALLRHTATAVGLLFGMLFIVPLLLQTLGGVWVDIVSYLPSEAGQAMTGLVDDPDRLSPLAGFAVTIVWVGALLAGAALALTRRDA